MFFCQGKCEVFPVIKGTPHHARSASEPYKLKGGKSLMWEKNLHRPLSSYQGKPNRTYQVLNPHGCLPGGTFHPFRGLSLDFLFYQLLRLLHHFILLYTFCLINLNATPCKGFHEGLRRLNFGSCKTGLELHSYFLDILYKEIKGNRFLINYRPSWQFIAPSTRDWDVWAIDWFSSSNYVNK